MTPSSRRRPTRPLNHEPASVIYAREKAGLNQAEAARRAGISVQLMSDIESGWRNATPATILKLAEAFNCPCVVLERKRAIGTPSTAAPAAEDETAEPDGETAAGAA